MADLNEYFTTDPTPGDPVSRNLSRSVKAYSTLSDYLDQPSNVSGESPQAVEALRLLAQQRIARGQLPPGAKDAPRLLRAGTTLEAQTPVPERGTGPFDILGNAALDVKDIFTSIPKLPLLLMDQVRKLDEAPTMLSSALAKGDFQAAAQTPGLNLIPGVYTLGNILEGDFGEIARHPVFTALDVAPAASAKVFAPASEKVAATRLNRQPLGRLLNVKETALAQEAAQETGRMTMQSLDDLVSQYSEPQKRSILQVIGDQTPIGRMKDSAGAKFAASPVGRYVSKGFGPQSSNAVRVSSHLQNEIHDVFNPSSPIHQAGDIRSITNPDHFAHENKPALDMLFEFQNKYVTEDGIRVTSNGEYTSLRDWEPRRREISAAIQTESLPDAIARLGMKPWEVQMVDDHIAFTHEVVRPYTLDHALKVPDGHDISDYSFAWVDFGVGQPELYPIKQAVRIENARLNAATSRIAGESLAGTPETLVNNIDFYQNKNIPVERRLQILQANLWNIHSSGGNVADALVPLRRAGIDPVLAQEALKWETAPPAYTLSDIYEATVRRNVSGRRMADLPPAIKTFRRLFEEGLYRKAWNELDKYFLRTRRKDTLPESLANMDMDGVRDTLRFYDDYKGVLSQVETQAKAANALQKTAAHIEKVTQPARFFPQIKTRVKPRMAAFARALGENLQPGSGLADELARYVENDHLSLLDKYIREAQAKGVRKADLVDGDVQIFPRALEDTPLNTSVRELFNGFASEIGKEWLDWKAEGINPVFVHAVADERGLNIGRIMPKIKSTVSQEKARTFDFAPTSGDISIAMTHQMIEWLVKKQTDRFIDIMANGSQQFATAPFTATLEELERSFMPVAEWRASRTGASTAEELAKLIKAQFEEFEPNQYLNFPKPVSNQNTQALMIDRSILATINEMAQPMKVSAIWDPVMGVFRTSVLTLSPRWQIYNLLGNALQITVGHGVSWMKYGNDAREVLRYIKDPENVPKPAAWDRLSENMRLSMSQMPRQVAEYQLQVGAALGKSMVAESVRGPLATVKKGATSLTDKLVNMNGFVDDMYRLMSYFDAYDKIGSKMGPELKSIAADLGVSPASLTREAIQAGAESQVRKTMYTWDSMTPFERQTMRYIFPFYGFMSHIARFTYRYAIDHPVRMAFTAAFARNELEDWKSGLPERLRSMAIFGDKGVNLAGWNPFGDVANTLTLTGWLSQVNPVLSTVAEQFGIDPRTGQANLYPESMYDPATGRLVLRTRNPGTALLENLIPQSQVLTGALGLNDNLSDLERSDPEAAQRLRLSAFGIPNLYREVDLPLEAMKAEGARKNAFSQAIGRTLSHPDAPSEYPQLNAFREQILKLQSNNPQALRKYTPASIAYIQEGLVKSNG